jgi:hypothetical protein
MKFTALSILIITLGVAFVGCQKETSPTQSSSDPLPANLFATTPPPGAVDIPTARKSAKDGQLIVVKGRVGGQKEPLAANRAILTLADLSLPTCDKSPMDKCTTPWDSCCEPKEKVAANSVSVQVTGPDGKPLKTTLAGAQGIAPLKQIIVAGIARSAPDGKALTIEAKQIYVMP